MERRWLFEKVFGWLSHWCGLHRKRAGRLASVASLTAANGLNNPA